MPSSARVALITGCGKPIGIGNSTARALAKTGATVVVSDVVPTGVANEHNVEGDLDRAWGGVESLVQEIVRNGGSASSTLGDVSVEADAARMVEEVLRRYGRLVGRAQIKQHHVRFRTAHGGEYLLRGLGNRDVEIREHRFELAPQCAIVLENQQFATLYRGRHQRAPLPNRTTSAV